MVDQIPVLSHWFDDIPLERMGCLLGANFNTETKTITCPGGSVGFAVYGPYLPVDPGFYVVEVDISTAGARNPHLHVELWTGVVVCKRHVLLERSTITLNAWIPSKTILEIRVYTTQTEFTVHRIATRRVDYEFIADLTPRPREHLARRDRLRAAIGFTAEAPEPTSPSAASLLDSIVGDPVFTWIEESDLKDHEALLRRSGINAGIIHYIFAKNNTGGLEGRCASDLTGGYPHYTNHFQLDILEKGFFELPSPFHDGAIVSNASFPILASGFGVAAVLYEFDFPFHVIVGTAFSWSGAISYIWFVDHDILIHDATQGNLCEWGPIIPVLRSFVGLCERHRGDAVKYRGAKKSVACFAAHNSNLGHFFWNDVSGVERVVRSGHRPRFVFGKSRRLSLQEIFHDDNIQIVANEVDDENELFALTLERNLLVVRPTGNTIDPELALKVERAAIRNTGTIEGKVKCFGKVDDDSFIVFYNLRAHNKVWVEQVDGAIDLVDRLRSDLHMDKIVLYLDGYEDCAPLVREIDGRLNSRCLVIDGTKASFSETLVWAYRCDFFVAVIGSGLVLLTWLAAKSGVCHADRRHMSQLGWWSSVRPNAGTILSPNILEVIDVEDYFYSDYQVKPSIISDLAIEFLKQKLV